MRTFVTTLFLVLSLFIIKPSISAEPDETLHQKCLYPTVRVHESGTHAGGTGIIVRSEKVGDEYHNVAISCSHVIEGCTDNAEVDVFIYEDWSKIVDVVTYKCKVYHHHEDKDLAILLFTSEKQLPVGEFNMEETLYIGTDIIKIGCGLGDEPRLDFGKITSIQAQISITKGQKLYRTNAMTIYGDSGGPVFYKNRVIGFTQAIRVMRGFPVFHMGFVIPASRIKTFDEEANNTLGFIYKTRKQLPVLPYSIMKLEGYEIIRDK
jgi:S1-C subfamily serine protease